MDTTFPLGPSGSSGSSDPASAPIPPAYRDRSGGLLAFGIVEIVLGGLALLGIPFALLGALLSRKTTGVAMPAGSYVLSITAYAVVAGVLITLGIGSIAARRWARALTLTMSWIGLVVGVLVTILLVAVMPGAFLQGVRQAQAASPNPEATLPTGVMAAILTFIIVFFAIFLIVLPVIFVLFYRRQDVEQTCRQRDPVDRWTDRAPLPVLAASVLYGYGGLHYLLMSFSFPVIPFFGKYLTGIAGALGCLVMAAVAVFLAVSLFRLKPAAWWIAVAALGVMTISAAVTYRHGNILQAYSAMGWKEQQLHVLSQSPLLQTKAILWWALGYMFIFLGYMLWIKRYFPSSPPAPRMEPQAPLAPPTGSGGPNPTGY